MILYSVGRWFYKITFPLSLGFNFLIRFVHNSAVYCQSEIGKERYLLMVVLLSLFISAL